MPTRSTHRMIGVVVRRCWRWPRSLPRALARRGRKAPKAQPGLLGRKAQPGHRQSPPLVRQPDTWEVRYAPSAMKIFTRASCRAVTRTS
jgi:hypothetical protein